MSKKIFRIKGLFLGFCLILFVLAVFNWSNYPSPVDGVYSQAPGAYRPYGEGDKSQPQGGWATPLPGNAIDYDKLNPVDFVLDVGSHDSNENYGLAIILMSCKSYRATRSEIDGEENRRMAQYADPTGNYLKRLEFERKVQDAQCGRYSDSDFDRVNELIEMAAEQGSVTAKTRLLSDKSEKLRSELKDLSENSREYFDKIKQIQDLLPKSMALVEKGDHHAAEVAGVIMSTDIYGKKDLVESARWLMVALQDASTPFKINSGLFKNDPYNTLSQQQIDKVNELARTSYIKCCQKEIIIDPRDTLLPF